MSHIPEFRNFIGGEWVSSSSGTTFENRNLANRSEVLGVFQKSTAQDVESAIESAREAYISWRLVPAPRRAEILFRMGKTLIKHKYECAQQMMRKMVKVLNDT